MKEINMEKLIELLNEYNEAEILDNETLEVNGKYHDIEYLYTKKFGFIKWLVENEKIDLEKVKENGFITRTFDLDECGEPYSDLESLLMLLAIQDNPIEFLISILK